MKNSIGYIAAGVFSCLALVMVTELGIWAYKLNRDLTVAVQQIEAQQADYTLLNDAHRKLQADYDRLSTEHDALKISFDNLAVEVDQAKIDLQAAREQMTKAQADLNSEQDKSVTLNEKIESVQKMVKLLDESWHGTSIARMKKVVSEVDDDTLSELFTRFERTEADRDWADMFDYIIELVVDTAR